MQNMHRETNALPPPPPHPARLVQSPSYYLPPRIPGQNSNNPQSFVTPGPQQLPVAGTLQPAPMARLMHPHSNQPADSYAPQQNTTQAHIPIAQQQPHPTQMYHNRTQQSRSPQPPVASSFARSQPAAPGVQISYPLPPARKARPESMPPLPASSQPYGGLSSFLPPPTAIIQLPSVSMPRDSPQRNATPAGTIRRPLPTPSPSKSSPRKPLESTSVSSVNLPSRQESFSSPNIEPSPNNETSPGPSKRNSRALPHSPFSPPDLSQLRLNDNIVNARQSFISNRQNTVSDIKAKFEGNGHAAGSAHLKNVSNTFTNSTTSHNSRARSLSTVKGNDILSGLTNNISRSPSPTSPQYGILDLPSRSRNHTQLDDVESISDKSESVVYAPSPVRAQRALQSPDIVSMTPDIDRASKLSRDEQNDPRRSNIFRLASTSISHEVKEAIYSENAYSNSESTSTRNMDTTGLPYVVEPLSDRSLKGRVTTPQDVPMIHVPPTNSVSTSGRPVITLTPTALIGRDDHVSPENLRGGPSVPFITLPDDNYESDSHSGPNVQVFVNDVDHGPPSPSTRSSRSPQVPKVKVPDVSAYSPATHKRSGSDSSYNAASPGGMMRNLPPPPIHRQSSSTNGYDQRGRLRTGGLVCGGCGQDIIGRIVSAMGRRWHPQCFRCTDCGELLEHVSAYEHDGLPYCHLDYHERFAPRCYHCETPIIDERFITLDDPALGKRAYHEQHFFCAECGDPFLTPSNPNKPERRPGEISVSGDGEFDLDEDDVGFTVYKGHPYCEACHVRLRMPKCKKCKRSIRPGMNALEALGGKWCWECFVCAACEKPFQNPSFFQRDQKPYCEPCFSLMLRNEI